MTSRAFPLIKPKHPVNERRSPWLAPDILLPAFVILLLLVMIFFPTLFTHTDPDAVDYMAILSPPSAQHWFGTDQIGRDVYSRVIHASAISVSIGFGATLLAMLGGIVLGTLGALGPRWSTRLVTRIIDIFLAFPELLMALLVIAVLGRGPLNTLFAVGISAIAGYARLVRSQVLQVDRSGFVEHAIVLGESRLHIILRHVIPNSIRPLLILATIGIGTAMLSASSLSFLGLGVSPPTAEWGALLADGRNYLDTAPWISLFPASMVAIVVISITLLGRKAHAILNKGPQYND